MEETLRKLGLVPLPHAPSSTAFAALLIINAAPVQVLIMKVTRLLGIGHVRVQALDRIMCNVHKLSPLSLTVLAALLPGVVVLVHLLTKPRIPILGIGNVRVQVPGRRPCRVQSPKLLMAVGVRGVAVAPLAVAVRRLVIAIIPRLPAGEAIVLAPILKLAIHFYVLTLLTAVGAPGALAV